MRVVRSCCGKAIVEQNGTFALVDKYTKQVTCVGTLATCEAKLDAYKAKLINR